MREGDEHGEAGTDESRTVKKKKEMAVGGAAACESEN